MVEVYSDEQGSPEQFVILVRSGAFPITVSWNIVDDHGRRVFGVSDGINGSFVPRIEITGKGSLEIPNPAVTRLIVSTKNEQLPTEFSLAQNYPNPFNPSTRIPYGVPSRASVSLKVYDLLGRLVTTLVNGVQESGFKSVEWDASGVASGVYFCRLEANNFSQTRKLVLLR
jgi:hypothetical protein